MQHPEIRRLLSGGVITNYNCPSYCGPCLYRCGPHGSADYVDFGTALSLFQTVRELGCHCVHIGGGEPLLRPGNGNVNGFVGAVCADAQEPAD